MADVSHEIRPPINAVPGFNEMILRESSEKEVLSYAANIKTSGQIRPSRSRLSNNAVHPSITSRYVSSKRPVYQGSAMLLPGLSV